MAHYVIIGNGIAGTTAAEHIRKQDGEGSITIVGDESLAFYNRMKLNDFIAGEMTEEKLLMKKEEWYEERRIEVKLGTHIDGAVSGQKLIVTEDKQKLPYDRLLVAAGSHSFIPPIKGANTPGVFAIRSIQDARAISAWAKGIQNVVLIGGGLLGLEAGNALRKLGKRVVVVEFFPRLLPRQLDMDGAKRLQAMMEAMGFSFRLAAKTQEILGEGKVREVLLEGGETLSAEMVIISAGVRPNLDLAKALNLKQDKGIIVDEGMRTSLPDVFAAGDVAEFKGISYGIWVAAAEQGEVAGINMAGGNAGYRGTVMANTLKVVGIDLASAGEIDLDNKLESRIITGEKTYKKMVFKENQVVGCILLGDTKGFPRITKMMAEKEDISQIKDKIIPA